jgi:hypothetical protein
MGTTLTQVSETQAQKATTVNEINVALAAAALFGRRAAGISGLTWAYFGGTLYTDGVAAEIADGTVVLTNAFTNYIEATRAGVVSANTTSFTAGRIPLYTAVTAGSVITSYVDKRAWGERFTRSKLVKSVAGGAGTTTLTRDEAAVDVLEFTGVLTGNRVIEVPAVAWLWPVVFNNTSGAFTLTVKVTGLTGVAVTQGKKTPLYCDATDVVDLVTFITSLSLTSASIVTLGVTGVASFADGAVGTPSITYTADANTGMYRVGTDKQGLVAGGVEYARIGADISSFYRKNILLNGSFRIDRRGAGAVRTLADDAYGLDCWYILSENSPIVDTSRLLDDSDGRPSHIRLKQTAATSRRMGIAQIIRGRNCKHLRGKSVTFSGEVRSSGNPNIRMAILEWAGTEDTVTSDVVNTWTSTTYTINNFFINDANLANAGSDPTSTTGALASNTWTAFSKTQTLGSDENRDASSAAARALHGAADAELGHFGRVRRRLSMADAGEDAAEHGVGPGAVPGGPAQFAMAAIEWSIGRRWPNAHLHRSVSVRLWGAFLSFVVWVYVCYMVLDALRHAGLDARAAGAGGRALLAVGARREHEGGADARSERCRPSGCSASSSSSARTEARLALHLARVLRRAGDGGALAEAAARAVDPGAPRFWIAFAAVQLLALFGYAASSCPTGRSGRTPPAATWRSPSGA